MLMIGIKVFYFVVSLVIAAMIIYGKLFVFGKKKAQFVSDYCATMAALIGVYALLSIVFALVFPDALSKIIMFVFALSPFAIGCMASYDTEKYYTILQIILLLFSMSYVVF